MPVAGNFVVETTADPALFSAAWTAHPAAGRRPPGADDRRLQRRRPLRVARRPQCGRPHHRRRRPWRSGARESSTRRGASTATVASADFNGDGFIDLVCNTYSDIGNSISFARLFLGDGNGGFAEDAGVRRARYPGLRRDDRRRRFRQRRRGRSVLPLLQPQRPGGAFVPAPQRRHRPLHRHRRCRRRRAARRAARTTRGRRAGGRLRRRRLDRPLRRRGGCSTTTAT